MFSLNTSKDIIYWNESSIDEGELLNSSGVGLGRVMSNGKVLYLFGVVTKL